MRGRDPFWLAMAALCGLVAVVPVALDLDLSSKLFVGGILGCAAVLYWRMSGEKP